MSFRLCWQWTVPALLLPAIAIAQTPPPDTSTAAGRPPGALAEEEPEEIPVNRLPPPLEAIRSNILDLETSGYFTVLERHLRVFGRENAAVWTIQTNRNVSSRHVTMQLEKFRDVRFYKPRGSSSEELYSTRMHYSPRLDTGAANGHVLGPYNQFEVWVYLTPKTTRRLLGRGAESVEFAEPPRKISLGL